MVHLALFPVLDDALSEWIFFFGRFHPVVLHLPIGLFAAVMLLEAFQFVRKSQILEPAVKILLAGFALSSVPTVAFGLCLAEEGGYSGEIFSYHKWLGITLLVLAFICLGLKRLNTRKPGFCSKRAYLLSLAVTGTVLLLASHYGGSLTHGSDYLTEYLPFGRTISQKTVSSGNADSEKLSFHRDIEPILEKRCYKCHGSEKQKGELRLDSRRGVLDGGESGAVIIPGKPQESSLYTLTVLPPDHEDIMPAKGAPLTEEQTEKIRLWILQGADFGDGESDASK